MNSRERREPLDSFEILLRESLMARVAGKSPSADGRRRLLQRAARQQRRWVWRLPFSIPGLFTDSNRGLDNQQAAHQHILYVEGLFGPQLSWYPLSQVLH